MQLDEIFCLNDSPLRIQTLSSFEINDVSKAIYYNKQIFIIEKERILICTVQVGYYKKIKIFRALSKNQYPLVKLKEIQRF